MYLNGPITRILQSFFAGFRKLYDCHSTKDQVLKVMDKSSGAKCQQ